MKKKKYLGRRAASLTVAALMVLSAALTGCGNKAPIEANALEEGTVQEEAVTQTDENEDSQAMAQTGSGTEEETGGTEAIHNEETGEEETGGSGEAGNEEETGGNEETGDEAGNEEEGTDEENKEDEVVYVKKDPSVSISWDDLGNADWRPYENGEVLTIKVEITNNDENVDMENVDVWVNAPDGFKMIKDLDNKDDLSDAVSWNMSTLEAGTKFSDKVGIVAKEDGAASLELAAAMTYENNASGSDKEIKSNTLKADRKAEQGTVSVKLTQDNTDGDIIVVSGQTVTYKATVTNTGKVDVKDVTVEGTLPSGLAYGSTESGSVTQDNGKITWKIDSLAKEASADASFTVTLPKENAAESYSFSMKAAAQDMEDADSNTVTMKTGTSTASVTIWQKLENKDATKDAIDVKQGEKYTYVIEVTNGQVEAKSFEVKMKMPGDISVDKDSLGSYMTWKDRTITWTIDSLAAGETKKAEFKAMVPENNASSKNIKVEAKASLLWTDTTGKPGSAESNTLVANIGGTTDKDGKPVNKSGIDVTVVSKTSGNRMLAYQDSDTVKVTAKYSNFYSKTKYTGTVTLVDADGKVVKRTDGTDATTKIEFTTDGVSGTIGEFEFAVKGTDYTGKSLYANVEVKPEDGDKCSFNGKSFDDATIRSGYVKASTPTTSVKMSDKAQAAVPFEYENLQKGQKYRAVVTLVDEADGKAVLDSNKKEITGTLDFEAKDTKGKANVELSFKPDDLKDKNLAVSLVLYTSDGKVVLAEDKDVSHSKVLGSDLAKNAKNTGKQTSTTMKNDTQTNKGGNTTSETVKTGEFDMVVLILSVMGIAMMAGAGWFLYKKKGLFKK